MVAWSCCEFTEKLLQRGSRLTRGWKAPLKAVLETATGPLLCNCVSPWNKLWGFCRALTCVFKGMVVCCNSQRQYDLNTDLFSLFFCWWFKGNKGSFVVSSLLPFILFVVLYLVCYHVFSCVGQQKWTSYEINSTAIFNLRCLNLNYHKFSDLFCKKTAFPLYLSMANTVFHVHRLHIAYMRVCTACFLFFLLLPHQ